jgi:alkylated DNA repair dioxygenase AlkB
MEKTTLLQTGSSQLNIYKLSPVIAQKFEECIREVNAELIPHPPITVFGKECFPSRETRFYSDTSVGYKYSNRLMSSLPLHQCMRELLLMINNIFLFDYNGILVNKYRDGNDSIGKHSDDEDSLVSAIGVIALSAGAVRKFRIRDKITGAIVIDVPTEPNTIIQMAGEFQKEYTHEVPVEKKVKETRISFTFRKHLM